MPARTDEPPLRTEDVGKAAGGGRGRQVEREKRASRLSGLFRSKSSAPAPTVVLVERDDNEHWNEGNDGAQSLASVNPLNRYSQVGFANYVQELSGDNQFAAVEL